MKSAWLAVLLIASLLSACSRKEAAPNRTATHPIPSVETTSTPPTATSTSGTSEQAHCLDFPSEESRNGPPCIEGTWNNQWDVTTHANPHRTEHVVAPLTAQFSLWAVRPGELEGTARLNYSVNATLIDTEATGCKKQTEIVKPIRWDVELKGQYFARPDGGNQIHAHASPIQGPSFVRKFQDCPIPDRVEPGVKWSAVNGKLVDGTYDERHESALPENSTGHILLLVHMRSPQKTTTTVKSGSPSTDTVGSSSDFTLSIFPQSRTVKPSGGESSFMVLIVRRNFTSPVSLDVTGLPPGVVASIRPNPAIGVSSTLTLTVASSTAPGSHTFTVTGTGGSPPTSRTSSSTVIKQ